MKASKWVKYRPIGEERKEESIKKRKYREVAVEYFTATQIILCDLDREKRLFLELGPTEERIYMAALLLGATSLTLIVEKLGLDSALELTNLSAALTEKRREILKEFEDEE